MRNRIVKRWLRPSVPTAHATVAELCFATQCALLLSKLSALTGHGLLQVVGWSILPLILVAQVCCWYAVVSLNHLGHAIEEISGR
jgi:hypothetical protein